MVTSCAWKPETYMNQVSRVAHYMAKKVTYPVPKTMLPGNWIVGGKSRLLDVWSASNITYWAPPFLYDAHELTFTLEDTLCAPPAEHLGRKGKLIRFAKKNRAPRQVEDSVILFDARHDTNSNVAHVLQNQIGVALTGLASLGMKNNYSDIVFIVHSDTPPFAIKLFETLGFRTIAASYDSFQGSNLKMQPQHFPLLSSAGKALREHAQRLGILDKTKTKDGSIFISRRSRRGLSNLDEIEALLTGKDFLTVYPEDLPIEDQIQIIAGAKCIFGIHGAALGFQLFRDPSHHGVVIECFPSAFITNWARSMSMQGGDTWLGCQGELSMKVMKNILGDAHPHDLEGENFKVCSSAVSTILRMANRALAEGYNVNPQVLTEEITRIIIHPNT